MGFQEVQRKKRSGKEVSRTQQSAKLVPAECQNKFQVLQEEEEEPGKEENTEEPMEITEDLNQSSKVGEGMEESMEVTIEQT